MKGSPDEKLIALQDASRAADGDSVARIWRELTPHEQEDVVFLLLGVEPDVPSEGKPPEPPEPDEQPDVAARSTDETAPLEAVTAAPVEAVEQTVVSPKLVEDLRGLSGSENDPPGALDEAPAGPSGPDGYRSRWLRRWKWSMVVAAWAVTTTFAFTANVSTFGPMEWFVAIFGSVVGGGLLVGTLLNFAVAAIPPPARDSTHPLAQ